MLTFSYQRKLSWTSTLQVSLTLALVNPVLWYLIDRSKPGFFLSTSVAFCGTAILLSLNPEVMPSPATSAASITSYHNSSDLQGASEPSRLIGGLVLKETVECGIWIVSVLFCSCVCFGNIGRRLALSGERGVKPGRSR
jgi:Insulin-induced protein (INSIG)